MANVREKLADSLEALEALQKRGEAAIRSADLSRTNRQRLLQAGYLEEVIKGWYVVSRPSDVAGDSTAWFSSFWGFCASYLNARFDADWSLSPEQSLLLHAGDRTVPQQLAVRSPKARNKMTQLAHGTAILETRTAIPEGREAQVLEDGLRVFALPVALATVAPGFYRQRTIDMQAILANIDAEDILPFLLEGGRTVVAGRIAGALRQVGRHQAADEILATMQSASFDVREKDPFDAVPPLGAARDEPPWVARLRAQWQAMADIATEHLPGSHGLATPSVLLQTLDESHVEDAYHSLSIEGYQVTPTLIERVRDGAWDPQRDSADAAQRDALAARGYYECFQAVKQTIEDICAGKNPGTALRDDCGAWYRALWAPSARAGIIELRDLAGFRQDQVFIRNSRHVPPRHAAVRDLMPCLFDLLEAEPSPAARAVLGHFTFVFIHPYMDGNGRLGRFLMNAMLATAGYAWCVVPLARRGEYMKALEAASVGGDIGPFARLLGTLVRPFDA